MSLSSNVVKFGSLALILAVLVLIVANGTSTQAQGAATTAPTLAATESSATARCVPAEVAVFTDSPRVHVKCVAPTQGILYFAIGTQDAQLTQRVLTVMTAALTANRALSITYDPTDTSGQAIGCLPTNCRMIVTISLER